MVWRSGARVPWSSVFRGRTESEREGARGSRAEGGARRGLLIHAGVSVGRGRVERVEGEHREWRSVGGTGGRRRPGRFCSQPPELFIFFYLGPFLFCFLFIYCSKVINLGTKTSQNFVKIIWLESLSNLQAQNSIFFVLLKYVVCIFIKGLIMPINRTFCKTINWGITPTPNFIKWIWLESLLRVESNHHHGLVKWKPFKIHLKIGKEKYHLGFLIPFLSSLFKISKFSFGSHF